MQNAVTIPSLEALPLLEATGSAVFVVSPHGVLLWQSQMAERLTLRTRSEAAHLEVAQVVRLIDEAGQPIPFWTCQADKPAHRLAGTGILVNHYGAEFPVSYTACMVESGTVLCASLRPPGEQGDSAAAPAFKMGDSGACTEGLRSKTDAEIAIRQCVEDGCRKCAAVFSVERLSVYRSRYGAAAVKQLKADYAQHLCHSLQGGDEIFEWGMPGFLILMRREDQESETQEEIKRIAARRLDCTLKGSSAIVSLQAQWRFKPLYGDESADDLIAELEQFTQEPLVVQKV